MSVHPAKNDQKKIITIDKDLEEITPVFLENRKKDILLLDQYLQQKNFNEIVVIGHKMAGNSRSYGHPELERIGRELEESAKTDDGVSILDLKKQIENRKRLAALTEQAHKNQMETLAFICVVETMKYCQQRDEGNFNALSQPQRSQLLRQNIETQYNDLRSDGNEFHFTK